jgi:hypothetical protein
MAKKAPLLVRWLIGIGVIAGIGVWLFSQQLFPGNSPLYDAIEAGDTVRAQQLLASGADPDSRRMAITGDDHASTRYQYAPLLYAIRQARPEIAVQLIRAGADPNARHRNTGDVALIAAAEAGMVDVVRELIAHGADVTVEKPDGSTALHMGRAVLVHGRPMPKDHLDPEIRAMLERAGAR